MKSIFLSLLLLSVIALRAQTTAPLEPTLDKALLRVIVVDEKKKPQVGEKIYFTAQKDGKEYSGVTGADGKFEILIPVGDKYKSKYKNYSGEKDFKILDIPKTEGLLDFEFTINVMHPKVFTLEDVFFDTGKSTLRPESNKALNNLAEYLSLKKSVKIEIGGHTDNVGDPKANQKLSEDRANTVRNYLIKKGIAADRVLAKGYGDTKPVADNSTPEGKQKNRRTEVRTLTE